MAPAPRTCYTKQVTEDMFDNLPHVQKRHQKYGIRIRVPDELRPIIGTNEITRSLKTGDPVKAKRIYYQKLAEVEAQLEAAREALAPSQPAGLTPETARALAVDYFREAFLEAEQEAHRLANDIDEAEAADEALMDVQRDIVEARRCGVEGSHFVADKILRLNGFPEISVKSKIGGRIRHRKRVHVDRASEGYAELLRYGHIGWIETLERERAILSSEPFDRANSAFAELAAFGLPQFGNQPASQRSTKGKEHISFGELFKRFLSAHKAKSDRWKLDMKTSIRPALEVLGDDTDANELKRDHFRQVLTFIRKMPAQIGNHRRWRTLSLSEIVRQAPKDHPRLDPKTVNKYMGRIAQVMSWAEAEPLIEKNYASGVRVPPEEMQDDEPSRVPFSDEALSRIFSCAPFTAPSSSAPSIYWMTLFALLHGMRSEEILQLRATDFSQDDDGNWFFELHRRDGNTLKNKSAIREVPVHPKMQVLGVESLIRRAAKRDGERLIHDISKGSENKFTSIFSRRFSRHLDKIGAKTAQTSFHSLRHNFSDAARNNGINDALKCAIAGWEFGSGVHTQYGSGFSKAKKLEAIAKIEYPGVDFSKIKIVDWDASTS